MLLILVLLLVVFSGCKTTGTETTGSVTTTSTATASSSTTTNPPIDKLGKYEDTVTVRVINDVAGNELAAGETVDDNRWTRYYKDRLNIEIETIWTASGDAYIQKYNVMLASGDIPDVFRATSTQLKQLLDADMVADLTDVYEEYMCAEYKSIDDPYMMKAATFDGKIMGIPFSPSMPYVCTVVIWIRSDWLVELGLPAPATIDDLEATAKAFMEAKLDGQEDTYGIAMNKNSMTDSAFMSIANAYHAYPGIWVDDGNGGLMNGVIQPGIKDALLKMSEWYEEGVIHKEFGSYGAGQQNQDLISGKVGIVFDYQWFPFGINDLKSLNPDAEIKAYPIVSADSAPAKPQSSASITEFFVVNKDFEYPEAIIKMANLWIATVEGAEAYNTAPDGNANTVYYGAPADAPGAYEFVDLWFGMIPEQNIYRYYINEAVAKRDPSMVRPVDLPIYNNIVAYLEGDLKQWAWERSFGIPNSGSETCRQYKLDGLGMINMFMGLPTDTMTTCLPMLKQIQAETFMKIVMGEEDIDAFDTFVDQWKDLGGDVITEEVNEWYIINK